tara:strand:+ start:200 stop:478 length:279 start_codon:yes stop_codon:yes gene_type:complete
MRSLRATQATTAMPTFTHQRVSILIGIIDIGTVNIVAPIDGAFGTINTRAAHGVSRRGIIKSTRSTRLCGTSAVHPRERNIKNTIKEERRDK